MSRIESLAVGETAYINMDQLTVSTLPPVGETHADIEYMYTKPSNLPEGRAVAITRIEFTDCHTPVYMVQLSEGLVIRNRTDAFGAPWFFVRVSFIDEDGQTYTELPKQYWEDQG